VSANEEFVSGEIDREEFQLKDDINKWQCIGTVLP